MLKQAILEIRQDVVRAAAENEAKVQQKCAQMVLAASGLSLLRQKITPTLQKEASQTQGTK